jgi:hypothetical protein
MGSWGFNSPGTRPWDLVLISLGGVTPFIIRAETYNEGNRHVYRLMGEAHVHGLMNGERLDVAPVQEIELR